MEFNEIKNNLRLGIQTKDIEMLENIKKIIDIESGSNRKKLELISILANSANELVESYSSFNL